MSKKTLVLGASLKPERVSNYVIHKLKKNGVEVVAFGLKPGDIDGVEVSDKLLDHSDVETITLYVGASNQQQYYDYILSLSPERVIFNPGTENPELIQILKENGISSEVACTLTLLATDQY